MELETLKELLPLIESAVTVVAIVFAGAWTYILFVRRRQRFPRASVQQEINQIPLPNDQSLLQVAAKISNEGDVLVSLLSARTRIQKIIPLSEGIRKEIELGNDPVPEGEQEVPWPILGARDWAFCISEAEIEPNETEVLHSEFVLDKSVKAIVVYTYVKNRIKRRQEIGWSQTTLVHLDAEEVE